MVADQTIVSSTTECKRGWCQGSFFVRVENCIVLQRNHYWRSCTQVKAKQRQKDLSGPGFRFRIQSDPVFLPESRSEVGFQISLDPDPRHKKDCRKCSKSYLLEENLNIMNKATVFIKNRLTIFKTEMS